MEQQAGNKNWWAIAASAVGSALNRSSDRKENNRSSKEDRDFLERMRRLDAANERAQLEGRRRWDLEDRRYREEAIGGYRQYSRGNYGSPEYSSTDPSRIEDPMPPPPANNNNRNKRGLLG